MLLRSLVALVAIAMLSSPCTSQLQNEPHAAAREQPVFRSSFVLKLHVDNERSYEERFDHVPYVAENGVYLFAAETFGANITMIGNHLSNVTYQPDPGQSRYRVQVHTGEIANRLHDAVGDSEPAKA